MIRLALTNCRVFGGVQDPQARVGALPSSVAYFKFHLLVLLGTGDEKTGIGRIGPHPCIASRSINVLKSRDRREPFRHAGEKASLSIYCDYESTWHLEDCAE
jgi:hypothetical protein